MKINKNINSQVTYASLFALNWWIACLQKNEYFEVILRWQLRSSKELWNKTIPTRVLAKWLTYNGSFISGFVLKLSNLAFGATLFPLEGVSDNFGSNIILLFSYYDSLSIHVVEVSRNEWDKPNHGVIIISRVVAGIF